MRVAFAVSAPAKVNLVLRVGPPGADGYHSVFSITQQVSLSDRICVRARRRGIRFECVGAPLPRGRTNLVVRAARRLQRLAGVTRGAWVRLDKRIPVGAGLGGGSSDAAATALALNRLWGLGWSRRRLAAAMAPLGSDVALFFHAPTAVVEGRGERVRPLASDGNLPVAWGRRRLVIAYPGLSVSTALAYRKLDRARAARRPRRNRTLPRRFPPRFPLTAREREIIISRFRRACRNSSSGLLLDNDFQPLIQSEFPVVAAVIRLLKQTGAGSVLLSGSGSAAFGVYPSGRAARRAAASIGRAHPGWRVEMARPLKGRPVVRRLAR